MSHSGGVIELDNALDLSSESDEYSFRIPIDEEELPWAYIEIDTWKGGGYAVEWPSEMPMREYKNRVKDLTEEHNDTDWDAVATFYREGTKVEISSTFDYVSNHITEPEEWISLRVINGPHEATLFITQEDNPNRFEIVVRDGRTAVFQLLFESTHPLIPSDELSPEDVEELVLNKIE
jgi:hypothetical protein